MQQSVRPGDGGVTVNVDVAHTTVYEAGPLSAFLITCMGLRDPRALERLQSTQYFQAKALLMHKEVDPPSSQDKEGNLFECILMGWPDVPGSKLQAKRNLSAPLLFYIPSSRIS